MKDYVCILIVNNYDCTINKSKALLQCHVCNPGHKGILTKGVVKKNRGGGGGPEHLEMWLIKNT